MTYLYAILAGAAGAAIGGIVFAAAAMVIGRMLGWSNFEGAAGMAAVFGFGPIGALFGLFFGIWLVLRLRRRGQGIGALLGRGAIAVVAIVALTALGLFAYSLSDDVLNRNGPTPIADFEIRLPAAAKVPQNKSVIRIDLQTDKNTMPALLRDGWLQHDGDRPVISGLVQLYYHTSQRLLVLKVPGQPDVLFRLKLASQPRYSDEFSSWQHADFIAQPNSDPRPAGIGDAYDVRYRVRDPERPTFVPARK